MAAPTIKAQNDRIRAILAAYPDMGTDLSEGGTLYKLPAFIVNPLGATRETLGGFPPRSLVTRNFEVIGLISEMDKITSLANRLTRYQDAEAVLEAWITWIARHQRLSLNDGGLVHDVGDISDDGFGPYTYGEKGREKDYSAFRLQIPVLTAP